MIQHLLGASETPSGGNFQLFYMDTKAVGCYLGKLTSYMRQTLMKFLVCAHLLPTCPFFFLFRIHDSNDILNSNGLFNHSYNGGVTFRCGTNPAFLGLGNLKEFFKRT